jgi:hypothetical protein
MLLVLYPIFLSPSLTPFEISSNYNPSEFLRDILTCLELPSDRRFLPTDTEDARIHYAQICQYTRKYMNVARIPYRDCSGPFLESEFIRRFSNWSLPDFGPFIPIFFPWFAVWKSMRFEQYAPIVNGLFELLRADYLYCILSESDFGVAGSQLTRGYVPNNVLILSPSGMGHIAVPWLQCDFSPTKRRKIKHVISFCGNQRSSGERKQILETARAVFQRDLYEYRGTEWATVSRESLFGFAPRGIAVGTYRVFELIRLETIPIVATDKVHWLPYFPVLNWSSFAIITNVAELAKTATRLRMMGQNEIEGMREALHNASIEFFQWDGFFRHLALFFAGGPSHFTCSKATLTSI